MVFFHLIDVQCYFSKLPEIEHWTERDCLFLRGQRSSGKFKIVLRQELPFFSKTHESKWWLPQCGMYDICHLTEQKWLQSWFQELAKTLAMFYHHEMFIFIYLLSWCFYLLLLLFEDIFPLWLKGNMNEY
jgi:hypothetical protein